MKTMLCNCEKETRAPNEQTSLLLIRWGIIACNILCSGVLFGEEKASRMLQMAQANRDRFSEFRCSFTLEMGQADSESDALSWKVRPIATATGKWVKCGGQERASILCDDAHMPYTWQNNADGTMTGSVPYLTSHWLSNGTERLSYSAVVGYGTIYGSDEPMQNWLTNPFGVVPDESTLVKDFDSQLLTIRDDGSGIVRVAFANQVKAQCELAFDQNRDGAIAEWVFEDPINRQIVRVVEFQKSPGGRFYPSLLLRIQKGRSQSTFGVERISVTEWQMLDRESCGKELSIQLPADTGISHPPTLGGHFRLKGETTISAPDLPRLAARCLEAGKSYEAVPNRSNYRILMMIGGALLICIALGLRWYRGQKTKC